MLTVPQEFLVDGKPLSEENEPWLHLGARDRRVQPLTPPAPPRLLSQPTEAQPWCQTAYFLNVASAAATASLIKCTFLLKLTRNVRLKGNQSLNLKTSQESPVKDGHPPSQMAEAFFQTTLVSYRVSAEHTHLQHSG